MSALQSLMQTKTLNRSCALNDYVEFRSKFMENHGIPAKKGTIVDRQESFAFNGIYFVIRCDDENEEITVFLT
jgi:hypothetical protein